MKSELMFVEEKTNSRRKRLIDRITQARARPDSWGTFASDRVGALTEGLYEA
jgi:hypothetical protein